MSAQMLRRSAGTSGAGSRVRIRVRAAADTINERAFTAIAPEARSRSINSPARTAPATRATHPLDDNVAMESINCAVGTMAGK